MNNKYTVNGKFLTKPLVGVQRYASEILTRLLQLEHDFDIEIAIPSGTEVSSFWKSDAPLIRVRGFKGNLWEQVSLPSYALRKHRTLVNLCNAAPLLKPDIVCIHDLQPFVHPEYLTTKFVIWYKLMHTVNARHAKHLITISEYSLNEILHYLHPKCDIWLVQNGWEHMRDINPDYSLLDRFKELRRGEFFFSLSTLAPNKNFKWVTDVATYNPDIMFAIAGGVNKEVFKDTGINQPRNVVLLGRLTDSEIKGMFESCKAFLFPTLYEGFGIPPLEALACGARIIVSDIPPMREIYGAAATYIDPLDANINLDSLNLVDHCNEPLLKYTWERAAIQLRDRMQATETSKR